LLKRTNAGAKIMELPVWKIFVRREPFIRRAVVLAEGRFGVLTSKTASCLVRYMPERLVAVIDSTRAPATAQEAIGVGGAIPVVSSLSEALPLRPEMLVIGIAPVGGDLPEEYRAVVIEAIKAGLSVVSGLHYMLNDDEELRDLARKHGVRLLDVRRAPKNLTVSRDEARFMPVFRVLTVGSDCSVGKMVTSWELVRALKEREVKAEFCATGQTGIMLAGWGVAVDRAISDFVAGAAEALVRVASGAEVAVVEGQGSIYHPAYSGVTLSLLHGCQPNVMILCHHYGRTLIKKYDTPIPPLRQVIRDYEYLAGLIHPSRVAGVAMNCVELTEETAEEACREAEQRLGVVVTDPVMFGADRLAKAVIEEMEKWNYVPKR